MSDNLPRRKNTRLQNVDYSEPGAYFVTICTKNRCNMLSNIVGAIHESPEKSIKMTEFGKKCREIYKNISNSVLR